MSKSYIEITSGFRNRLAYPNPADFITNPCEPNSNNTKENSNNISAAYPFYNFWSLPLHIVKRWDCAPKTQIIETTDDVTNLAPSNDCCNPVVITDTNGSSGIVVNVEQSDPPGLTFITVLLGCDDIDLVIGEATISGGDPSQNIPSTVSITAITEPSSTLKQDTGYYKPQLLPINYGLDVCSMHRTTQTINNPASGLSDTTNLQNQLTNCCIGTAGKPIFSNKILPIHSLGNVYNWKTENNSCNEVTSMYNNYSSSGLIHTISADCCSRNFFSGMIMTNFTPDTNSTIYPKNSNNYIDNDAKINNQNCSECSQILATSANSTLSISRCCDITIPVRSWNEIECDGIDQIYPPQGSKIDPCTAYSTYLSINPSEQVPKLSANNVGCGASCPVTDSIAFDMTQSFSRPFKCVDWFDKNKCWDQIDCQKAQYNPYITNNQSWNCVRVQGGGPSDSDNAYCCNYMEMIPAPIDAYKNYQYALPNGLSDRFKIISTYNSATKLCSFNSDDCCNSIVQKQWQRMIYWMLYARCGRGGSIASVYNPDELCEETTLNKLANGNSSSVWGDESQKHGCGKHCDPTHVSGAINTYSIAVGLSFTNVHAVAGAIAVPADGGSGCEAKFNISPTEVHGTNSFKPEDLTINCHGTGYKVGDVLVIPPSSLTLVPDGLLAPTVSGSIVITVESVIPTVFWPDLGLSSQGTNYIWNYRMRQQLPTFIATSNPGVVANTVSYSDIQNPTETISSGISNIVDYSQTTPPLFLFDVPYEIELVNGGNGYSHGGYFIFGVDNCDMLEISFNVNCGKVVSVNLTKLAIDETIYDKLNQNNKTIDLGNSNNSYVTYQTSSCDIGKQVNYFNTKIPDIIELNQLSGSRYTYNWNGSTDRKQNLWFGGSGACIRIKKSYGFFSNLGHTERTNYAHQKSNTRHGPSNNDMSGSLLFLPSVAEACKNNLGELRNSLNFSTFYQTNKTYLSKFNTISSQNCIESPQQSDSYNLKYQVDSPMKFVQQYPKVMSKEVGCTYNYAEPPFNSDSTGTTPVIANYSTQNVQIVWRYRVDSLKNAYSPYTLPTWDSCKFQSIGHNKQTKLSGGTNIEVIQHFVQSSVLITQNAFPGFPMNIDGLWDINAAKQSDNGSFVGWDTKDPSTSSEDKNIPAQCCAYEWEILPVTNSSVKPISNQTIPRSSLQETACWKLSLRNLLLPNTNLQSGSRASFYPYFYVEFTNLSDTQRQHRIIQSNNPNSTTALFRCAITDNSTPTISKYIKLSGDGISHNIHFNPNDSFKFKVFLPDGREFMTSLPDNAPPSHVNPLLQVSALFEAEYVG